MCDYLEDSFLNIGVKRRQGVRMLGRKSACEANSSP